MKLLLLYHCFVAQSHRHWASLVALALLVTAGRVSGDTSDLLLADFESGSYGEWTATGAAFGSQPFRFSDERVKTSGLAGRFIASSLQGTNGNGGFALKGALTSPEFTIERDYLQFLIGGGKREVRGPCVKLLREGKIVRVATAFNTAELRPELWDVRNLRGQRVRIEISDPTEKDSPARWGYILADRFVQTDAPTVTTNPIARAMQAVAAAVPHAERDPQRPRYHFRPPAQWMNDVNAFMRFDGWYHVFYQHNPYADTWEAMHWGHARSRDLVRWEHLPIALWPSHELGEEHVFSGNGIVRDDGLPMLFYTSIKSGGGHREEWAALSRDGALTWEKLAKQPIVAHTRDGKRFSAQDPFVFRHDGQTWLLSVSLNGQDKIGGLHLYRARNAQLDDWEYKGRFSDQTGYCPNLVEMDGKWVLFLEHSYHLGTVDWEKFKFSIEKSAPIAHSARNASAANILRDGPNGRPVFACWITDRKAYDVAGRGWSGNMSLPQELFLTSEGSLGRRPIEAQKQLRGVAMTAPALAVTNGVRVVEGVSGHTMELQIEFTPAAMNRSGLSVRRSADGKSAVNFTWRDGQLVVSGTGESPVTVPAKLRADGTLQLHVFLDRAVLEYYVNDGAAYGVAYLHNDLADTGVAVFSEGSAATVKSLTAWPMKSAWPGEAALSK